MNKWEKEVQQSLLNDEQQVLNVLKMAYAGTLRDVQDKMSAYFARIQANPNDVSAIYQFRYQQALQDQIYNILDNLKNQNYQTISEYLEHSYENGWLGAMYDIHRQGIPIITPINQENAVRAITINSKISVPMYTRLGTDIDRLRVSIAAEVTRGIVSGSTWHDTAARISGQANISAYNAMRIARTEGHRVQCNAQYDACNSAKQSGADVVNQWDSTMDSRTRDTHRRLHKQLREVGQPFEIDGKKALYPGAFGIPEEDIHCRCALLQRARWALSEAELQQLRNTPEAKALAETSDFEEFKSKYLEITENSANSLTNSGGNGTIISRDSNENEIEITNDMINNLQKLNVFENDAVNQLILEQTRELLREAQKHALGTEIGKHIPLDLNPENIRTMIGDESDHTVDLGKCEVPAVTIHNHPSGETFSGGDISRFIVDENARAMYVIGNNGKWYALRKNEDFNWMQFQMKTFAISDAPDFNEQVLREADSYGFTYYHES